MKKLMFILSPCRIDQHLQCQNFHKFTCEHDLLHVRVNKQQSTLSQWDSGDFSTHSRKCQIFKNFPGWYLGVKFLPGRQESLSGIQKQTYFRSYYKLYKHFWKIFCIYFGITLLLLWKSTHVIFLFIYFFYLLLLTS